MSETTDVVEQAIAKEEAEAAGIDTSDKNDDKGKGGQDDKKGDDAAGKSGAGKDGKPAGDKGDDKKPDDTKADDKKPADDKDKKDEKKYSADDALEVEEPAAGEPKPPTDNAGIQLSPEEGKYIADNIGDPIVIRGVRGVGDDAKEVEIKAYSPQDIPADFKFANDQQLSAATTGFQKLEQKAADLLGNYRQNQSASVQQDFERRENEGIRADVADLQKADRFPMFSVQPGAPGFDESPEAQQMAEVLAVMTKQNETYLAQYNQGRPYKHIGFAEAFNIWERDNPERQAAKKADDDQKKEDAERKKGAESANSNRGTVPSNIVKPTVKSGTTTRDILARIDAEED